MARAGRVRKGSSGPQPLGDAIQSVFRDLGMTRRMQLYEVLTSWDSIVGERIAKVATARKVENGILFVDVKTAPWRAELAMRKQDIMDKIRRKFGKNILRDIRFY
jgi:predicted nucleic acid-binding Zn ribbon protein